MNRVLIKRSVLAVLVLLPVLGWTQATVLAGPGGARPPQRKPASRRKRRR